VWRRGLDPDGDDGALRQYVVGVVGADAFGRADLRGVWLHALDVFEDPELGLVPACSAMIDYADPHTRDRVCRAWLGVPADAGAILATIEALHHGDDPPPWADRWPAVARLLRDIDDRDVLPIALRAVAAAVWGGE
jgi:hypothetical protein